MVLLLSVLILPTSAQKKEFNLPHFYRIALEKYPGVHEKISAIQAAQLDQKLVKSKQIPQTKLQLQNSFGTLNSSSGAFFPVPGMFTINGGPSENKSNKSFNSYGSFVADWQIFSFGKLNAEHQASNLKVREAVLDLSIYELDLQSLLSRLYLNVLYNDVRLKWSQENVSRTLEIHKIANGLAKAGLAPGADTALSSSAYHQLLSEEDLLRGKLASSIHQLNEFLSLELQGIEWFSNRFLEGFPSFLAPLKKGENPYLYKLANQVDYHDSQQKIAAKSRLPSFSLLAGFSSRGFSHDSKGGGGNWARSFNNQTTNYLVGIGLTWNLTGIYDKGLEKRRSAEFGKRAAANYQKQELKIAAGIRSAEAQIAEQIKQVSHVNMAVNKAEEAYFLYRTRYENGLINLTELLQIQWLLQQAEEKKMEAFKGLWEQVIIRSEYSSDFNTLFEHFN